MRIKLQGNSFNKAIKFSPKKEQEKMSEIENLQNLKRGKLTYNRSCAFLRRINKLLYHYNGSK